MLRYLILGLILSASAPRIGATAENEAYAAPSISESDEAPPTPAPRVSLIDALGVHPRQDLEPIAVPDINLPGEDGSTTKPGSSKSNPTLARDATSIPRSPWWRMEGSVEMQAILSRPILPSLDEAIDPTHSPVRALSLDGYMPEGLRVILEAINGADEAQSNQPAGSAGVRMARSGHSVPRVKALMIDPPEPPFSVNTSPAGELMATMDLSARQARMVAQFRSVHGPFATPDDIAQVAGITDEQVLGWEEAGILNFD